MSDKNINIVINALDKFKKSFDGAISQVGRLGSAIAKMGSAVWAGMKMAAGAVSVLVGASAMAVREYMKDEDSQAALAAAIESTGKKVDEVLPKWNALAIAIQKTTKFDEDSVRAGMAMATNIGITSDKMEEATKAAVGMAASFNLDLVSAFTLIARTAAGNTTVLERMGIHLTGSKAEKYASLIKIMAARFTQAEAQGRTLGGTVIRLKNAWGELVETVGGQIAKGLRLDSMFESAGKAIDALMSKLEKNKTIQKWAENLRAVFDALLEGGEKRAAVMTAMGGIGKTLFGAGIELLARVAPVIGEMIGKGIWAGFTGVGQMLGETAARSWTAREQLASEIGTNDWTPQSDARLAQIKKDLMNQEMQTRIGELYGAVGATGRSVQQQMLSELKTLNGKIGGE